MLYKLLKKKILLRLRLIPTVTGYTFMSGIRRQLTKILQKESFSAISVLKKPWEGDGAPIP